MVLGQGFSQGGRQGVGQDGIARKLGWGWRTCLQGSAKCVWQSVLASGFPGSSAGKESAHSAGDPSSIPGLGRSPGQGCGNPLQYSWLENPHGQRSLAGYSS